MHIFRRNQAPLPVGVSSGGTCERVEPVQQRKMRIGKLRSLDGVKDEFAFYTPALLHLFGQLTFDPLTEFTRDYGKDPESVSMSFTKPLFRDLVCGDDLAWNYVLYAMPHEHWDHYRNWLHGVGLFDREKQSFLRIRSVDLAIADPLHLEYQAVIQPDVPTIAVCGLALETNRGSYYLRKPRDPLTDLPQAMWLNGVYPDTREFAERMFRGEDYVPRAQVMQHRQALRMPNPTAWDSLPELKRRELEIAIEEARNWKG